MLPGGIFRLLFTAADVLHLCRELGQQQSVIELDTPSMTTEQMAALEQSVNEKIRERIPVTVRELAADDSEVETVSDGSEGSWQYPWDQSTCSMDIGLSAILLLC